MTFRPTIEREKQKPLVVIADIFIQCVLENSNCHTLVEVQYLSCAGGEVLADIRRNLVLKYPDEGFPWFKNEVFLL